MLAVNLLYHSTGVSKSLDALLGQVNKKYAGVNMNDETRIIKMGL
jgi:hypothetical protein